MSTRGGWGGERAGGGCRVWSGLKIPVQRRFDSEPMNQRDAGCLRVGMEKKKGGVTWVTLLLKKRTSIARPKSVKGRLEGGTTKGRKAMPY